MTVKLGGNSIDARCTCPYDGADACKHVVAVLLYAAADPPNDESERVEGVIQDISADDLQTFVHDVLATNSDLRERFRARFGDTYRSVEEYREEIEELFDQHTQDCPVVSGAIDFSHFFDVAERYRERDRYVDAATVYRAIFEGIDDNQHRIDTAYDHYARIMQTTTDGYIDCVLATDPGPEEFETHAGVLDERASTGAPTNRVFFFRMLGELDDRR